MAEIGIRDLAALADDPAALQEIGRRVVVRAVRAAAEERVGVRPAAPDESWSVARGEAVPEDLRDEPDLEVDASGLARKPWLKTWQNLGPWHRSWREKSGGLSPGELVQEVQATLSPEEWEVVQRLAALEDE